MGKRFKEWQEKEIIAKWETNLHTTTMLANEYGFSPTSIRIMLKRNGVKTNSISESKQKYSIDESFFEKIDTEQKAYFLGFLYADGYHHEKTCTIKLDLQEKDVHILYQLNDAIKSNKPIKNYKRNMNLDNGSYAGSKDTFRLMISNKKISSDLKAKGLMQAKSLILEYPDFLNEDTERHFIRGYFDGNGSVSTPKNKNNIFTFIGATPFIVKLQERLINELGLSKTKISNRWDHLKEISTIGYCGTGSCLKFKDYIYKDATLFLTRKKEKFDTMKIVRHLKEKV